MRVSRVLLCFQPCGRHTRCDEGQLKLFRNEFILFNCADFIIIYNWEINDHLARKFCQRRRREMMMYATVYCTSGRFGECMHLCASFELLSFLEYCYHSSRVDSRRCADSQQARNEKWKKYNFTSDCRYTQTTGDWHHLSFCSIHYVGYRVRMCIM